MPGFKPGYNLPAQ